MNAEHRVALETGVLQVEVREAALPLDELCGFAARNNRKRGFLFVSKVLGKHWPVRPSRMRQIHQALAEQLELGDRPWAFIAMAETATGLGHGVFEAALELHPDAAAVYCHSTRYLLDGRPYLAFEEPHCHAPDQFLYHPLSPRHRALFMTARELVVVDDEISTGTTLCNLVDAYRRLNPDLQRVHFVAITDFSGMDGDARFGQRLGLPVRSVSVLRARFDFAPVEDWTSEAAPPAVGANRRQVGEIADDLGRFGIDARLDLPQADVALLGEGLTPGASVLVLGTGEFMHLAFRVGLDLEALGFDVSVQATSRSPILVGADVGRRLVFPDNYGEGIQNYLYNVDPADYDRIVLCHETPADGLEDLIGQLGATCMTYRYPHSIS